MIQILKYDSERQMEEIRRAAGFMGVMEPHFKLTIHRESILEESLTKVLTDV